MNDIWHAVMRRAAQEQWALRRLLRDRRGILGISTGRFQNTSAYSVLYDAGTGTLAWTPNMDNGNVQLRTASVTGTLVTPSNAEKGMTLILIIVQDGTGSRVVTWPTNFHFPGGTEGVLSTAANSVDILSGVFGGTNWLVALSKDHKA